MVAFDEEGHISTRRLCFITLEGTSVQEELDHLNECGYCADYLETQQGALREHSSSTQLSSIPGGTIDHSRGHPYA